MGIAKELIDRFFFFFLKKQGFFSGKGIFLWGFYVRWRFVFLKKQGFFLFKGGEFFYGICIFYCIFLCAVALIGFGILKRGMRKYGCKCGGWG